MSIVKWSVKSTRDVSYLLSPIIDFSGPPRRRGSSYSKPKMQTNLRRRNSMIDASKLKNSQSKRNENLPGIQFTPRIKKHFELFEPSIYERVNTDGRIKGFSQTFEKTHEAVTKFIDYTDKLKVQNSARLERFRKELLGK
ncbi:unnamed protein product [Blepharisma stoltei]|uniref:Uncharacterized protein n=1 Tax=Blepharisma stoltei TaxID=1481888 RepID=A0AAU9KAW1_9CILI|nr:unnamed protein product [Blepharisma stoltei]